MGREIDQPLAMQSEERLADRRAAHLQLFGEAALTQLLARTEGAGEDRLADHMGNPFAGARRERAAGKIAQKCGHGVYFPSARPKR